MTVKMIRSLARRPDRMEGQEVVVSDEEGRQLVEQKLAEVVEPPKPAPPKK